MLAYPDYPLCLRLKISLGLAQVVNTWHIPQIFADRAVEMLKALVAKPDDLNFIPGTRIIKRKN